MKHLILCIVATSSLFVAQFAHAGCEISSRTAQELISIRHQEIPSNLLMGSIKRALKADLCVSSKGLRASELNELSEKVLDYSIGDQWLAGEINEYLNM